MTSAISKGSGASKSANALKSIFVRIQEMSSDGSVLKLSKQFDEFGISMTDLDTGKVKDAYTLLQELSVVYQDIMATGSADKQNAMRTLVNDIGGIYNSSVLNNILSGFSTAVDATAVAMNSAGSAQTEFDKSLDSIKKKADATKGAIMELAWGNGGLKNLISAFLDGSTGVLRFINDTKALSIVLLDLSVILAIKLLPSLVATMSTLVTMSATAIPRAISAWQLYMGVAEGAEGATIGLGTAINASLPIIGLVIAGISALVMGINKHKQSQEEAKQKSIENANAIKQESDAIKEAITTIKDENTSRSQIISAVSAINTAYGKELDAISDVNEARAKAIGLLEKESIAKAKQFTSTNMTQYMEAMKAQKTKGKVSFGFSQEDVVEGEAFQSNLPKELRFNAEVVPEEEIKRLNEIINKIQTTNGYTEEYSVLLEYAESKVTALTTAQEEQNTLITTMNENLAVQGKRWDDTTGSVVNMTDAEKKEYQEKKDGINTAEEYANAVGMTTDEFEANAEALGMTSDEYTEYLNQQNEGKDVAKDYAETMDTLNQAYSDSLSSVSEAMDAYSTLSDAMAEYNENGEMSFDTLSKLASLSPEYLAMLSEENGQLTLNTEALKEKVNAEIDNAKANVYASATERLNQLAKIEAGNATNAESLAMANEIANVNANSSAMANNAQATYKTALAKAVLGKYSVQANVINKQTEAQIKTLNTMMKSVGSTISGNTKATGKSAKATGGATKATKSHTDALKEQQKALQDTVDKYEKVISYINKKVDDQIDKLKDLKDTALDAIDAQISALETQRDAEEDLWNDKIDALNAQNDALEDQIKLEQLLQALALAQSKKVRIFREGKGFVYESDQSAVSEAQKDLAEYNRQAKLKAQVKELELARDAMLDVYNKQISDLEAYKKSVEASYDAQIKYYEDWKDKFKEQTDAFEDEQNRLLALQLTGIDFENQNWTTRLGNLSNFVNQYRAYQQQLADLTAQINASAESAGDGGGGGSSGGGSGGGSTVTTPTAKKVNGYQGKVKYTGKYPVTYNGSTYRTGQTATFKGSTPQDVASQIASFIRACGKSYANQIGGISAYASGVASVTGDQYAFTGEGKDRELVLGSKANGTLTKLDKGSGVVNAKSLSTFAGILNTLGASGMTGRTSSQISNMSNSNSQVVNIANITLPEVKDPQGFTNWLSDFNNNMTRRSYSNA